MEFHPEDKKRLEELENKRDLTEEEKFEIECILGQRYFEPVKDE